MRVVSWIGAVLFAGSLGYFMYFLVVVLGSPADASSGGSSAAVAWNVALFTTFALHHSVLARPGVKARLTRVIPIELERPAYVWAASLLFLMACILWQPLPCVLWDVQGPGRTLLHGVLVIGIVLTLGSAALLNIWYLAGVAQAARDQPGSTRRDGPVVFTARGPYGWLRHPIYLGWVLIVFGAPTMTASRALFAAVSTLYLVIAIPLEERSLVQEHGEAYREYQRLVRWRLIPGVW